MTDYNHLIEFQGQEFFWSAKGIIIVLVVYSYTLSVTNQANDIQA